MKNTTKIRPNNKLTAEQLNMVRKNVDYQTYFDEIIVPNMPDYYSGFHEVHFDVRPSCKCPVHTEDTGSFKIRTWGDGITTHYCFGCGIKGDIINLNIQIKSALFGITISSREESARELYEEFILKNKVRNYSAKKMSLVADRPVELSTVDEVIKYKLGISKIEGFLNKTFIDSDEVILYYKYMDKLSYLVENNRINATVALEALESQYKSLVKESVNNG